MADAQRLTTAKGDIRNTEVDYTLRKLDGLIGRQLIAPRLVRTRFFAAGDAVRLAAIG